jgi:hypothetical protein
VSALVCVHPKANVTRVDERMVEKREDSNLTLGVDRSRSSTSVALSVEVFTGKYTVFDYITVTVDSGLGVVSSCRDFDGRAEIFLLGISCCCRINS